MPKRVVRNLSISQIEYVAHRTAQELMQYGEPIPPFDTRYPDVLESCLKTPFQKFRNKSLYPTIERKAAALFYLMIKNHPFQNGNKRVAVVTLLYFLGINGRWLTVVPHSLYEFAKKVAESDPGHHTEIKEEILSFIKEHMVKG